MHSSRKWKPHHPCVENDDKNNGECAEKVEAGLTCTIGKTRVDCRFAHSILTREPSRGFSIVEFEVKMGGSRSPSSCLKALPLGWRASQGKVKDRRSHSD